MLDEHGEVTICCDGHLYIYRLRGPSKCKNNKHYDAYNVRHVDFEQSASCHLICEVPFSILPSNCSLHPHNYNLSSPKEYLQPQESCHPKHLQPIFLVESSMSSTSKFPMSANRIQTLVPCRLDIF